MSWAFEFARARQMRRNANPQKVDPEATVIDLCALDLVSSDLR